VKENFDKSFEMMIKHEGGFVNHPRDPGGMTNLGVTKATWEAFTGKKATEADMRALTKEAVKPVYKKNYWDKVRGDQLPSGVDYAVFDYAVNSGPGRAARALQRVVGATADGAIGPLTLAKVEDFNPRELVLDLCEGRMSFLKSLSTWNTFGRGWSRRVKEVEDAAYEMAK
jgi:lysozyme family protein